MGLKPGRDQCEGPLKHEGAAVPLVLSLYVNAGVNLTLLCFSSFPAGVISVHLKKDSLGNLTLLASPGLQAESCGRLDHAIGDSAVTIWHKCKWAASTGTGSEHTLVKRCHTQITKTFKDR